MVITEKCLETTSAIHLQANNRKNLHLHFYSTRIVLRSIEHFIKTVSSTINPPFFNSWCDTNFGHPLAMFMSDFGFRNELLEGSGWNVSTISCPPRWLISLKVTLWVKGHCRMLSNSFRITMKKRDMCVFLPMPSPRM